MAGARITFEFRDAEFVAALKRLDTRGAQRAKLLRAIGTGLVMDVERRFGSETDPQGHAWAGLSPAYAALKGGTKILSMSGQLRQSVTMAVDGSSVVVGSNKVYAAVHQFGATIRPKSGPFLVFRLGPRVVHARSVRIPARPYLGFGPAERTTVMDALDVLLPGGR